MSFSVSAVIGVIDNITAPLKAINKRIEMVTKPIERLGRVRANLARNLGITRLGRAIDRVRGQVTGLTGALGLGGIGLGASIAGLGKGVISSSAEMEKFMAMLTTLEGSSEKAGEAMDWILDTTTRTPLQLAEVTSAYIKMRTFGLDPTNGSLVGLIDQMAKMGGGAFELEGIILAVGQAWSKGKLQGEEALQLIERGVPVWDLLAKQTGRTAAELQELSSKGKLGKEAIAVLIQEIGKASKGAAAEQMKTFNGLVSNLMDRWTNFQVAIGNAGFFDAVKASISGLLDELERMAQSGELQQLAKDISDGLVAALQGLKDVIANTDFRKLIADVRGLVEGISGFVETIGGWRTVLIGVAAIMSGPLLSALSAVASMVAKIGAIMLANPISIAVAGIAYSVYQIYENWDGIVAWFGQLAASITSIFEGLAKFITGAFVGDHRLAVDGIMTAWSGLTGFFKGLWDGINAIFSNQIDLLNNLVGTIKVPFIGEVGIGDVTNMATPLGVIQSGVNQSLSAAGLGDPVPSGVSAGGAARAPVTDELEVVVRAAPGTEVTQVTSTGPRRVRTAGRTDADLLQQPGPQFR